MTLREQIVASRYSFPALKDQDQNSPLLLQEILSWSVEGTPADSCRIGLHGSFEADYKPDLLLSGINRGANTGLNVLYSGTVAAAMEGVINGIPSMALSLNHPDEYPNGEWFFESAAFHALPIIRRYIEQLKTSGWKEEWLLNVTLPNCPRDKVKGVKMCKQGKSHYGSPLPFGNRYDLPFGN